jgi:hypothetical protein
MIAIALVCLYLATMTVAVATARGTTPSRVALERHITRTIIATHRRQTLIGLRHTPTRYLYKRTPSDAFARYLARWWDRVAASVWTIYTHPPHKSGWLCIHHYEGSWTDAGDPYWGGLQMDRGFMRTYAPAILLRLGWANRWTPLDQMWVAERAHRSGRGYGPWPNTARYCGLL